MKQKKQLSLMDGLSLRERIEEAAKKATRYITTITGTDGISVHDAEDTSNYVNIASGLINIVTGGTSRLKAFVDNNVEKLRVGDESADHIMIEPDSIDIITGGISRLKAYVESNIAKLRLGDASTGHIILDPDGMAVKNASDELASFGAEGMRIGKIDEKHIEVTDKDFNVYDEDGSTPFYVSTASSLRIATKGAGRALSKSSDTYPTWITYIYLEGSLEDNEVKFGVNSSNYPTSFPEHIILPSNPSSYPTELQSVTLDGIVCSARWQSKSTVYIKFENTTNARTNAAYQFTDRYYETSIKANDAVLTPKMNSALLRDTIGTSKDSLCYFYTYGHIVHLCIGVYNTNSIYSGGTIYEGYLMDNIPAIPINLFGCYGAGKPIWGQISSDGKIYVLNSTGNNISSSDSNVIYLTATYINK